MEPPTVNQRIAALGAGVFVRRNGESRLLAYHQITTWCDFHPFNAARHYSRNEKLAEAGSNAILMGLAPVGFALHVSGLMTFGVVYYFVLFAIELIIW